jgi:hypothetical protein
MGGIFATEQHYLLVLQAELQVALDPILKASDLLERATPEAEPLPSPFEDSKALYQQMPDTQTVPVMETGCTDSTDSTAGHRHHMV